MQKTYREFFGTPIRDRLNKRLIGRVDEFVIDPTNGEILAFFTRRDKRVLLPTRDVSRIANGVVWVEDTEALASPDEIVRIKEIIQLNIPIFGNKVFTMSRHYLGEVVDFYFEANGWVLARIEVAKKILTIPTEKKLINSSQIVRIKPNEITVRDAVVKVKSKKERRIETAELSTATFKMRK